MSMWGDDTGDESGNYAGGAGVISSGVPTIDFTAQDEFEHNRRVFGQTYRERHGKHKRCIVLCLNPGQRTAVRCPTCYGRVAVLPVDHAPAVDPPPTRGERFAGWLGRTLGRALGEFLDALAYPFRASADHRAAIIRDTLQDVIAAGLTAEVVQTCPQCATAPLPITAPADTESDS